MDNELEPINTIIIMVPSMLKFCVGSRYIGLVFQVYNKPVCLIGVYVPLLFIAHKTELLYLDL